MTVDAGSATQPEPVAEPVAEKIDGKQSISSEHRLWRNPITVISFIIIISVMLLIAASVVGVDKGGTLGNLARIEYARDLITYLFAVGTIGAIIAIMLAILVNEALLEEKTTRAKSKSAYTS